MKDHERPLLGRLCVFGVRVCLRETVILQGCVQLTRTAV